METRLIERWFNLAARMASPLDRDVALALFDEPRARYAGAERHYHTLGHIAACLDWLESARRLAADPGVLGLAIWYHDAVYDTHRPDNEEASARLADAALQRLGIALSIRQRVSGLILATRHNAPPAPPGDPDTGLLVDIDLAILGQPAEVFDAYEAAIRREYAWVADEDFRAGRRKVLQTFLHRPHIFATGHFRALLETPACENLARSLARLAR
jgi:predicted metal-dependent HD superfamily phosphohydrolase